jgi:hypothetical protein
MKLWEYVLKYDKKSDYIKWLSEREEIKPELILKEGYCPGVFECFNKTGFDKPLYLHSRKSDKCKSAETQSKKKCNSCWDREIVDKDNEKYDEYEQYLKLKEKFEKRNK